MRVMSVGNMPVDVIATFNVEGRIKPNYIRIEDESHELQTYKIDSVVFTKEERYAGSDTLRFCCDILQGNRKRNIQIKYHIPTHQWVIENP